MMQADSSVVRGFSPSPNFGDRAEGSAIDMLILHYTGMPSASAALKWLCTPESQVSCHYFVDEAGDIIQLVSEDNRAWHAGRAFWDGVTDINSHSIGIEISNPGHEHGYVPFPDVQIEAVIQLCQDILARRSIPDNRILAHSDVAPDRKEDPGELFPWQRLSEAGVGLWEQAAPLEEGMTFSDGAEGPPIRALQTMLSLFGYDVDLSGVYDQKTRLSVIAFQRHYRQETVDGVADLSTIKTLNSLIRAK